MRIEKLKINKDILLLIKNYYTFQGLLCLLTNS